VRPRLVVLEAACWWVFTLGLWCAFIGNISSTELLAGTAAGLICGLTVVQLRVVDWPTFRPALRWLGWVPLVLLSAVAETGILTLGLWRWVVAGRRDLAEFRTIPLGPAGIGSAARARHALATVAISATPGSIVLQTYPELGEARVHVFGSGGPDLISLIGDTRNDGGSR
jgi:multisubunit Na+/H+ antiporter MnhE subunit